MEPKIVVKPAFTVVGMLIHTKPNDTGNSRSVGPVWPTHGRSATFGRARRELWPDGSLRSNTGQLDYMAGEAVVQAADLPPGMTHWDVPANTYAVFETTLPAIGDTFGHIYNTWLSTSGYQQVAAPYFERYGETFDPSDPTSTLSIYIPVENKA